MAVSDDARLAAFRMNSVAKMRSPISAVGEHLPRIVGKSRRTRPAIVDAGRRDLGCFLDQRGVGVGADMRFETMNGGLALRFTQWPSSSSLLAETMIVASTSVPVLTLIALALSWPVISSNSDLSNAQTDNALRKRTKAVRFRSRLVAREPDRTDGTTRDRRALRRV